MEMYLPRPQSLSKGGEENEKKASISHHALPGNDITATDLYSLQLHCTVPNEGPAEEAGNVLCISAGMQEPAICMRCIAQRANLT